jgi:tetratricopeptide (TPR) repeat protein
MSTRTVAAVVSVFLVALCAFEAGAQSALSQRLQAVQLMKEGRYTEAEAVLTRLVARAPSATNTYLLGSCLLRRYQHDRALAYLRAATDAEPSRHVWLNTLAECHLEMGDCAAAIAILDRAIAVEPSPVYHYNKAMCALNLGELELAEAELGIAVNLRSEYANALTKLGQLMADEGRDREARKMLERSLAVDGDQVEALFVLGQVEARLGRPEEAVRRFGEVLDLYPTHSSALYNLGRTLTTLGRKNEADQAFSRFAALSPAEDAVQNYRDYLATVPTAVPERVLLAEQLFNLGRFDESLLELEIVQRLDPAYAPTYELLTRVYTAAGNPSEAHRAQVRAQSLRDPGR